MAPRFPCGNPFTDKDICKEKNMSKPMTRVVFSVLICMAIIAAVFTVAYAASQRAGQARGRIPTNAGLTVIIGSDRTSTNQTSTDQNYEKSYPEVEKSGEGHGGCESDYNEFDD
jgi:hypothetical protein